MARVCYLQKGCTTGTTLKKKPTPTHKTPVWHFPLGSNDLVRYLLESRIHSPKLSKNTNVFLGVNTNGSRCFALFLNRTKTAWGNGTHFTNDSAVVIQKVGENQGKALSSSLHTICLPGYRLTLSQAPSTLLFNSLTNRDAIHKARRRGGTAGDCLCSPALMTIL